MVNSKSLKVSLISRRKSDRATERHDKIANGQNGQYGQYGQDDLRWWFSGDD